MNIRLGPIDYACLGLLSQRQHVLCFNDLIHWTIGPDHWPNVQTRKLLGDDLAETFDGFSNLTLFDGWGADLADQLGAIHEAGKACRLRGQRTVEPPPAPRSNWGGKQSGTKPSRIAACRCLLTFRAELVRRPFFGDRTPCKLFSLAAGQGSVRHGCSRPSCGCGRRLVLTPMITDSDKSDTQLSSVTCGGASINR
jgi:hypothetical protein